MELKAKGQMKLEHSVQNTLKVRMVWSYSKKDMMANIPFFMRELLKDLRIKSEDGGGGAKELESTLSRFLRKHINSVLPNDQQKQEESYFFPQYNIILLIFQAIQHKFDTVYIKQFESFQTLQLQVKMDKKIKTFLLKNKQNGDFNQYWYSPESISFLAQQASKSESGCFLSTPSIFYSLDNPQFKKAYYVFDLDEKFGKNNPNYFKYDFNKPEQIPQKFNNYFDFVLADPPFITNEVWQKYAYAINKIIKKNEQGKVIGKILLSTIDENQNMLFQILGVKRRKWRPSIPHLVYQYSLYSNYEDEELEKVNPQIGE